MLARVEIESKEGHMLLRYNNPWSPVQQGASTFSLQEKLNGLIYRGFFLRADNQYIAREILKSLIFELSVSSKEALLKKHAMLYSYIDNYLTSRHPIFLSQIKKKVSDPILLAALPKKKVYVEVSDTIIQRMVQGKATLHGCGEIIARPTDNVGEMAMKIDSRSLCSMQSMQFSPLTFTKREGITTFVMCPSKEAVLMRYTFQCDESVLSAARIVLIDAKTIEIVLATNEDAQMEAFKASLIFDFLPGAVSIECAYGKHEYLQSTRTLHWTLSVPQTASITIHCTEPHRGSMSLHYKYYLPKTAVSGVVVNSLASNADENWIKQATAVSGYLRPTE